MQQNKKEREKTVVLEILAHVEAGKTTLSEAMLYISGNLRKLGRVDNQDAFLDTYALERQRGITIFSKQAVFAWEGLPITLLDTPGHVDFSAEMERTLQVLDCAVLFEILDQTFLINNRPVHIFINYSNLLIGKFHD